MSKSSKVQPIRPSTAHSLDDLVSVIQTEILQAQSIVDLAWAKLGDDHADATVDWSRTCWPIHSRPVRSQTICHASETLLHRHFNLGFGVARVNETQRTRTNGSAVGRVDSSSWCCD